MEVEQTNDKQHSEPHLGATDYWHSACAGVYRQEKVMNKREYVTRCRRIISAYDKDNDSDKDHDSYIRDIEWLLDEYDDELDF